MDAQEFHDWMIFDLIDPIGDRRLDVLFTLLRAAWVKGGIEDLLPNWGKYLDEFLPVDPVVQRAIIEDMFAPLEKRGLPKQ